MNFTNKQLAQFLFQRTQDMTFEERSKFAKKFVLFLRKINVFSEMDNIMIEFKKIINDKMNTVEAEIEVKSKLTRKEKDHVKKIIQNNLGVPDSGKDLKVKLKEKINKKMLGGFKLRFGDKVVDGTIRVLS